MEGLLPIAGVIIGATLVWIGDRLRELMAHKAMRCQDARRAAERIMGEFVELDRVRFSVRKPSVSSAERDTAYAKFQGTLPSLLAAVDLARMVPMTDEARESLKTVDDRTPLLHGTKDNFHEFTVGRGQFRDALLDFLGTIERMAPYRESPRLRRAARSVRVRNRRAA
jgi:hypothetical protein